MMRCASLGSGSRGNATVVESGTTRVLVDCGFSARETRRRLQRLDLDPDSLSAILVTHEHRDHIAGVGVVARNLGLPVYMTAGTARAAESLVAELPELVEFGVHEPFELDDLRIEPFPVPHDARDPAQFVIVDSDCSVGLLTDAGHVTPVMRLALAEVDFLMLEFNHDQQMLRNGNYPPALIARVDSDYGHLNNGQAVDLLNGLNGNHLKGVAALHLSQENNHPERVQQCLNEVLKADVDGVAPHTTIACQNEGFGWFNVRQS